MVAIIILIILQHMAAEAGSCHESQAGVILRRERQLGLQELQLLSYLLRCGFMKPGPVQHERKVYAFQQSEWEPPKAAAWIYDHRP